MPLSLGGVSTERNQVITFDPNSQQETADAMARMIELGKQGFRETGRSDGKVVMSPPDRDPCQGLMRILSENGDDRVVWDRRDPGQVKEAYQKFKELLAKGYTAYSVMADGKKGHKIEDFDPGMEEVFMSEVPAPREIVMVPKTMPG